MALGTARTCSSLSSSGVIILIRLGRLPEGESRVPPPLEAARASIVLLSFGTRAGRMRVPARAISSFWQTAAQRATGETSDDRIVFQRNGRLTVPFNLGRRVGFNCDLRFFHTEVASQNRPRIRLIAHAP
jgi:hypothetical protein